MGRSSVIRLLAIVGCALLVAWLVVGPSIAAAQQAQPGTDNTVTRIHLFGNGSARWTISIRTRLDSQSEMEQFRRYQERIRTNESAVLGQFRDRMTNAIAAAENATGRSMAAKRFAIETRIQEVPQRWGVVTYEFTWVGFARVNADRLVVGDVFQGGFFLSEGDRLVVTPPDGFTVDSVAPSPDETVDRSVVWTGRRDFADGKPRLLAGVVTTGTTETESTMTSAGSVDPARTIPWVGVIAAVVVLGLVGGLYAWRRRSVIGTDRGSTASAENALMADDERVRVLLEDNDGQMRQSAIADELDWTASKTSRIISDMEDSGAVEKVRLGRENVVRLPEESE